MGKGMGKRGAIWAALALLSVFGFLMISQVLTQDTGTFVSIGVRTATVLACVVGLAYRALHVGGRLRRARLLLCAALALGALSGLIVFTEGLVTGEFSRFPDIADVVFFMFVPLAILGLLTYPMDEDHTLAPRSRSLLDGAMAATALWFVIYGLILAPSHVGEGVPLVAKLTVYAYPLVDVIVIGMILGVLWRVARSVRREILILGGGLCLLALADISYSVLKASGSFAPDSWVAVVSEAGLLVILLVILNLDQARAGSSEELDSVATSPTLDRILPVLPFVPVVMAVAAAAALAIQHQLRLGAAESLIGMLVLMMLLLQQWVGTHDRQVLMRRSREREQLFSSLVTGSSDLITLHFGNGDVKYASPALARALGVADSDIDGNGFVDLVHSDDRDAITDAFADVQREPGACTTVMIRLNVKDEGWRWMQTAMHNMMDDRNVAGIVCNTRDVHEEFLLRRRLSHDARHDALTGLGNLAAVRAILAENVYGVDSAPATIVLVDIDGFTNLNDTFGHAFGDALLRAIGWRLRRFVADEDALARIGGDEFVLIFDALSPSEPTPANVLEALHRPLLVEGTSVIVEASIGVARSVDATSPEDALRNADLAMHTAKSSGRNQIVYYERWMYTSTAKRLRIQEGLRRALDEELFTLHYQPVVRLPRGELVGAEALIRWTDPDDGFIPPDVFIPIAEGSGIIADIDSWVLNEACRQLAAWNTSGLHVPWISINVSRRQLGKHLPDLIDKTMIRHQILPSQLCIEVTESTVAPDAGAAFEVLKKLRSMGLAIALDDFGTGQSSLSQLAMLPLDKVKIDKSFVMTSSANPRALRFLTSVVGVCRSLNLPMIAEGIEDAQAATNLAEMSCEFGQGYFFARPAPPAEFAALVESSITRSSVER